MQAIFHFLVQIGTLPPYTTSTTTPSNSKLACPIGALLKPFDALTLLITAIGHDVGHPGVNNAFLVSLNAPLAQLYNDKSVLEAFHCAAYSQILRRHWAAAFEDIPMRSLMINSILATDMGVHMKYMSDLGNLQEKLHHNKGTDGWSVQVLDEYRVLACALLVKCADISNVVSYACIQYLQPRTNHGSSRLDHLMSPYSGLINSNLNLQTKARWNRSSRSQRPCLVGLQNLAIPSSSANHRSAS